MKRVWVIAAAVSLLAVFEGELLLSVHRESQTSDESVHLYAGYTYWKRADFGINPEHPPLAKLVAALPLLPLHLALAPARKGSFRAAGALGGLEFLYSKDADALLFRARAAATLFALALAVLVFAAAGEMFGPGAALCALALLAFEPSILGHGPLITTDIAASATIFASIYAFYRYCRRPTILRQLVLAAAVGLALAAKHSTILIFPMLALLVITEIARKRSGDSPESRGRQAAHLAIGLAAVGLLAVAILWSFYGFRYGARPPGEHLVPAAAEYLGSLTPAQARVLGFFEQHRLLPEAYLYGLNDVARLSHDGRSAFLLGRLYPVGQWFYFPAAFVIKSTLGFLLLLILAAGARGLRRMEARREVFFLAIPPLVWMAAAMSSKLNIGVRHILPVYPFLIVLAGAAAWMLMRQSKPLAVAVCVLLAWHAGSSLMAFPNYLPYSNEAFGGATNTYKRLSDSNVGWQGGLKALSAYIEARHISKCWFAYDGTVDPSYYHIPCVNLPTLFAQILGRRQDVVPEQIEGPVFIGSLATSGFDFGPQSLNPYQQFAGLRPSAVLQGEILVFDGTFHVPKISGWSHLLASARQLNQGRLDEGMAEARASMDAYPDFLQLHEMMSDVYFQLHRPADSDREFQAALAIYRKLTPDVRQFTEEPQKPK